MASEADFQHQAEGEKRPTRKGSAWPRIPACPVLHAPSCIPTRHPTSRDSLSHPPPPPPHPRWAPPPLNGHEAQSPFLPLEPPTTKPGGVTTIRSTPPPTK
ncbi:hypothetical protein ACJQWK_02074 [Exserohilum turcicum]